MLTELLLSLVVAHLTWSLVQMEITYRRASSMGIPLVRNPVDSMNPVWIILAHRFDVFWTVSLQLGSSGRYSCRGWNFYDKAASHLRYGPVWALVTPYDIYVYRSGCDARHFHPSSKLPPSKQDVQAAWLLQTKYLDCQLDGIGTRLKDPGSALNENIMRFVWDESLDQAREMLQSWTSGAEPGITRSVAEDTRMLSLNILAATGFL